GETGNVYLFAHSEDTFYNVNTYNAPFFLLGKLTRGDEIYVFYKDRKFKYVVDQVKVVSPEEVNYLTVNPDRNTLTLQTDYPPGMTFARRIVIADEIGIE
ncbi:MAG: Sortase A, LPXTG specific, partial [Microgenomates group bacterium GW2011_GWC1_43_13]